jgi:hypothetical protein
VTAFDAVVDPSDAARPGESETVFEALEPVAGPVVRDGGAGTALAPRALFGQAVRGLRFDIAAVILGTTPARKAWPRGSRADGVVAAADGCADLVGFAPSCAHHRATGARTQRRQPAQR